MYNVTFRLVGNTIGRLMGDCDWARSIEEGRTCLNACSVLSILSNRAKHDVIHEDVVEVEFIAV